LVKLRNLSTEFKALESKINLLQASVLDEE
jgi:hypothetical protein